MLPYNGVITDVDSDSLLNQQKNKIQIQALNISQNYLKMDHRPKCTIQNYKTLGRYNIGENLDDRRYGVAFLGTTPKAWPMK